MNATTPSIREPARDVEVVARADVVVVGGGPAGMAAAIAAARNGASTVLLERYNHLGGLASGGMVLVLDDMWDAQLNEISVRGVCLELIERLAARDLAAFPRQDDWGRYPAALQRWTRWGAFDFHSQDKPHPIVFAAAFDPDGFKRVALEMVAQQRIELRLHSWFSHALIEDGHVTGVVCDSKSGRQAILGRVVIDATGDLDVAASAGAPHIGGAYMLTTVFRLGNVDTDAAERFEREEPERFAAVDKEIKRLIGGSWAHWWLKTPLARRRLVQLPAHDRSRWPEGRGPDRGRGARPRPHSRHGRLRARPPAGVRARGRDRRRAADRRASDAIARRRIRDDQGRSGAAHALRRRGGARPRLHDAVSHAAAEADRQPARRRPSLLGDVDGAEDVARDPAVHGDGRGRRRRRGDGARRRRPRPRRRRQGAAGQAARARRRPGRPVRAER